MNWPSLASAVQHFRFSVSSYPLLSTTISLTLVVVLLYKSLFRLEKRTFFPTWAIIEIALVGLIVSKGGIAYRILLALRRHRGSLYGLTSGHQVLVQCPGADRLLSQPYHTITAEPVQYTLMTRVFGATDTPDLRSKIKSWKDLFGPVERIHLNDAAATAAIEKAEVHRKAASLVTFSDDARHMKRWELSAGIRVVTPDSPDVSGVVEANLQSLVRDFGACISIPVLYGQDFMDRYPQLLDDFWKFDNDLFPLLLLGVPTWAPFRIVREGIAARSRLANELAALYRRVDQYQRGEPVDFGADMSDIGSTALGRNEIYRRDGWSMQQRGNEDLSVLWGQNANTQPVVFWLLAYVYSTPDLVEQLREEVSSCMRLSDTHPREILSMNLSALSRDCTLLKACVFETYRMTVEATSIRYIARSTSLNDGSRNHQLNPGMFVSVPHALTQRDPRVYADPDKFVPDRFLEVDPVSGKTAARYGKLKPWGSGAGMCKGRSFAEKEILAAGAAIMTLWDISPADGIWKLPAMVPGTGVKKPVQDIRVSIRRRNFL